MSWLEVGVRSIKLRWCNKWLRIGSGSCLSSDFYPRTSIFRMENSALLNSRERRKLTALSKPCDDGKHGKHKFSALTVVPPLKKYCGEPGAPLTGPNRHMFPPQPPPKEVWRLSTLTWAVTTRFGTFDVDKVPRPQRDCVTTDFSRARSLFRCIVTRD